MVNFLKIFLMFVCLPSYAAVIPSGVPSITVNGIGTNNTNSVLLLQQLGWNGTSTIFTLNCGGLNGGTTVNQANPCAKNGVLYQVTAGKKATCFNMSGSVSSGNVTAQLVSATATFAANTAVGTLTSPTYQTTAATGIGIQVIALPTTPNNYPGSYVFDATSVNSWPGYVHLGTSGVGVTFTTQCFEQ